MIRGCIFYENTGCASRKGIIDTSRPVVVVSNRIFGKVVQVVPLTSSEKKLMETNELHIPVCVNYRDSIALCEQIRTVHIEELSRAPKCRCTEEELRAIDTALKKMLFGGNDEEKEQDD